VLRARDHRPISIARDLDFPVHRAELRRDAVIGIPLSPGHGGETLRCASVPLLERMMEDGRLPTVADLFARGQRLPLETPAVDFPAASSSIGLFTRAL
jgi:hypothetical protein